MKKILLFLLTFLACTYSAQAEDWLYLLGDFNDWSNNETYLFKYHNGSYTLLVEDGSALKDKSFKFGNNYGTAVWYGADNTGIKTPYKVYPKTSNSNNMSFGDISNAVIFNVYNYKSGTQFDCAITSADLYIRGLNGNWDANAATQFDRAGYIYTKTVTLSGKTECKIADNSYNTEYGLSTAITKVGTYDLTYAGGQAGFDLPDGTYDLTFDFSTLKLTVAAHSETPTYPTSLYLYPGGKEIPAVAGKDGVYSVTGLTKSEIASFRFNTKSDNSGTAYGTTTGADVAITLGDNIDMKEGGGNRWTLTPEFDGTYDIEIDLSTMKFFVTQSKVTYPDVIYYYNGTKPCTVTMAKTGEGSYSADIEVAAGEFFRFYTDANATDDNTSYGAETADQALTLGSDITIVNNTTNKWSIAEAGTYTFTVSLKHHSLNVVKKSETPTYTEYWLISEVIDSWKFNDKYQFHTDDGVTYTLKNIAVTAGKLFKISDKTHYLGYGDSDGQLAIADQATGYKIYSGKSALKWHTTITVNITYTRKSDTEGEIKVEYVYPDLWVRGGMTNNDWAPTEGYKMTCTDGVYTLENVALSNTEFKIGSDETGEGVEWTYGFGAASGATQAKEVYANGIEDTIYDVNHGQNLKIGEVSGKVDITFTPNFTAKTGTLKIVPHGTSGINDVEIFDEAPVEFYNLQGVRVDGELTPGLYIRRQGNSASKVLIR